MFNFIEKADHNFFLFLNGNHNTFSDTIMYWVSNKYFWLPFYVLLLALVVWKFKKKSLLIFVSVAVLIFASDQTSVLIKNSVKRYRPCYNSELQNKVHLIDGCGGQYGFVSSHTANSFALATFLSLLFIKKRKSIFIRERHEKSFAIVMFFWAALVSYSRIAEGVHYPLDILGGAMLGIFIGMISHKIYFRL
ncbi:MAG: phosphatase PAP2 family protein [Bacteroidota bacterium]